jgi:hypothetical protein
MSKLILAIIAILVILFFSIRGRWFYRRVYLHTPYWRAIRRAVGRRAGWRCQVAGCKASGEHLNAHHITYRWWLEWLNLRDLVWLCATHHAKKHAGWVLYLKGGREI